MTTLPSAKFTAFVAAMTMLACSGCNITTRGNSARGYDIKGIPSLGDDTGAATETRETVPAGASVLTPRSSGSAAGTDPLPGDGTAGGNTSRSGDYRSGGL